MSKYNLEEIRYIAANCSRCELAFSRKQAILDDGYTGQKIMLIGEGPGELEDDLGRPFVGPAGKLLDSLLSEAGMARERLYICNVLKCRPINNATPTVAQTQACSRLLLWQLEVIKPELIIAMGNPAAKFMLSTTFPNGKVPGITSIRGRFYTTPSHTAYILRDESKLPFLQEDFLKISKVYKEIYREELTNEA
jgi:uracil-DNA glycosylase family 4